MISTMLYLFILLMFGMLIATWTKKKIEEVLPLSCVIEIGFLFVFGLAGLLNIGLLVLILFALGMFIWSLGIKKRSNQIRGLFSSVFSSSFMFLLLILFFLTIGIKGKLFNDWDEFSHWGDVIKATVDLNGFSTNPDSLSAFQTYPPGMVIFQYIFQRIHILTGGAFSEWRSYFSYNLFLLCFMAPVFSKLSIKKPVFSIIAVVSIILLPTIFYTTTYYSLYIDVAVSIVFGYGLYSLLNYVKDKKFQLLSVCAACFILPLLKDVGMFFSFVLLIIYIFMERTKVKKRFFVYVLCSVFVPVIVWRINVSITNASQVFSFKYDAVEFVRVLFGKGDIYRQNILKEFPKTLITKSLPVGNTGISINYLALASVISVLWYISIKRYTTLDEGNKRLRAIQIIIPIALIVYIIGLQITYMFQFSEYEAERFMSFERYISIPICGICISLVYVWTDIIIATNRRYWGGIILCIIMLFAPLNNIYSFMSGDVAAQSKQDRIKYLELESKVQRNTDGKSTIYIISQQDNGKDFWVLHYLFRPNKTIIGQLSGFEGFSAGGYSIGKPWYEGDVWSSDISPDELMKQWLERYDYVAVLQTNDYLTENYSSVFDPIIIGNGLYYIDKNERKAKLIE